MGYLKTVLTYDRPSEAEVDKSFLESHGISVCLLNGNTTRNELGCAFYIQLQVNEGDYEKARGILFAANPARFGSADRVAEIDRAVRRLAIFFAAVAIPIGVLAFWLLPQARTHLVPGRHGHVLLNLRFAAAALVAIAAGTAATTLAARRVRPPEST